MLRILGIDPGTARMGYSVIEIKITSDHLSPRMLDTSTLVTPAHTDMSLRLQSLYEGLNRIIDEFSPNVMVLERLFFNTNAKTAISVGQARGVAMLSAARGQMPVFEYTALEAKRILTGYGRASKKEMQQAVKERLGLTEIIKSDDANDALAMALCFLHKDLEDFIADFDKNSI